MSTRTKSNVSNKLQLRQNKEIKDIRKLILEWQLLHLQHLQPHLFCLLSELRQFSPWMAWKIMCQNKVVHTYSTVYTFIMNEPAKTSVLKIFRKSQIPFRWKTLCYLPFPRILFILASFYLLLKIECHQNSDFSLIYNTLTGSVKQTGIVTVVLRNTSSSKRCLSHSSSGLLIGTCAQT